MFAVKLCLLVSAFIAVQCVNTVDHSNDHHCPFGLFDGGRPMLTSDGGVMYCDVDGVRCPDYYFCSGGYADNRAVCCHILGP